MLTHDVETAVGAANIGLLRGIETERGFRSSWNFVPHRYDVADELVQDLTEDGFEIGVHGLKHDGRDLESLPTLERRLPEIRRYAERWHATGFRSPATHRRWEWMPLLGFDYDSSYPDTDPYEPQAGGCCSWLPFTNGDLVELPIMLPQDYTLFTILRVEDERPWLDKATFLRDRGGMALMITHPDYMLEQRYLDVYARLLDELGNDETLWRALPRDVSAWWRRRAESSVRRNGSGWVVPRPGGGRSHRHRALAAGAQVGDGGLGSVADAELAVDRGEMELDRVDAQVEALRDLAVLQPLRGHLEHGRLARRERREHVGLRLGAHAAPTFGLRCRSSASSVSAAATSSQPASSPLCLTSAFSW